MGCRGVAGMKSARDIGRGDERHQFGVMSAAFTKIAIQINLHSADETARSRFRQVISLSPPLTPEARRCCCQTQISQIITDSLIENDACANSRGSLREILRNLRLNAARSTS